ncbi:phosphoglycolate phosphatase [Tamilnaduibacter salinus]|uniref:HAD family hydrolase n=1 Tax=Tamilnaduibacter salinus TaxID=1484056 RepID=A0A2A2I8L5_9GAMM|nr:HAD-IA family hydrolase [Tamilnaduibacter salinus]PAV27465.1 HAD family hydrolase [Tamilnaduibacter salinus]PVY75416.1 phosphoglycolate phosphatase [Tamilnaduibacter salinus]
MTQRVVIFDWDGTLVDSVDHIADSLHQAATDMGFPPRDRADYRDIIGLGMVEALDRLYPGMTPEEMRQIREGYARYFFQQPVTPQSIFEGMAPLLESLSEAGRPLAVATGKSRPGLSRALASSGLGARFGITCCADETRSKPDPAMLHRILAHYDIAPGEAVMIGDTVYDMEMAARVGMPSVGVSWGVHSPEQLNQHDPVTVVQTVTELRDYLLA